MTNEFSDEKETNQLIWSVNSLTGFFNTGTFVNELREKYQFEFTLGLMKIQAYYEDYNSSLLLFFFLRFTCKTREKVCSCLLFNDFTVPLCVHTAK